MSTKLYNTLQLNSLRKERNTVLLRLSAGKELRGSGGPNQDKASSSPVTGRSLETASQHRQSEQPINQSKTCKKHKDNLITVQEGKFYIFEGIHRIERLSLRLNRIYHSSSLFLQCTNHGSHFCGHAQNLNTLRQ